MEWIILIVPAVVLADIYRGKITAYFKREADNNRELNHTDQEIEIYVSRYAAYPTEELARLAAGNGLLEKERIAIRRILMQRQMFP